MMQVTHLRAKNWRNFRSIDVPLTERQFMVGPNASGKSNFLDIFRFLRDVATTEGGGLQKTVKDRGGVTKIRNLAARKDPEVEIDVEMVERSSSSKWRYRLAFKQESRGKRQTLINKEYVAKDDEIILNRPEADDALDKERLTQTFLEQINANKNFRNVATFFQSITYLHLVPQLLRYADTIQGNTLERDPFGQGFLERVAKTPEKTRQARLKKIEEALQIAVPQMRELEFIKEEATGQPHLQARYTHWRPKAGKQREDQFSDGTLRLIGLLWAVLEGRSLLLLEEPELSLNPEIVTQIAPLIYKMQKSSKRRPQIQVLISTHSDSILREEGIDGSEVLVLDPSQEGTNVSVASNIDDIRALLEAGFTVGEAVLPHVVPNNVYQLTSRL